MRCVLITPLLFLATMLFAQVTYQMGGRSSCPCIKTSDTVLRKENIRSYTIYKAGSCPIDAVQFNTVKSRSFCSDPEKPWVKRAIQYVDEKNKTIKTTARPISSTSTLNTTSALNHTGIQQAEVKTTSPELC